MQAALKQPQYRPSSHRPIDLAHLASQTMGDRTLECEILTLFGKQLSQARASFAKANADERKRLAHTIKGRPGRSAHSRLRMLPSDRESAAEFWADQRPWRRDRPYAGFHCRLVTLRHCAVLAD